MPPEFAEQIMANATKKIEGLKKVKEEVLKGKVVPDNYAAQLTKIGMSFNTLIELSDDETELIICGGQLPFIKSKYVL